MLDSIHRQDTYSSAVVRPDPTGLSEEQVAASVQRRDNLLPESETRSSDSSRNTQDSVQISAEAREVAKLETRDREVRSHEAAHAAVGGQYAGSPSLTYTKGPDGRSYATGGEVSISISSVNGDPLATLQKAETVRAAALAPAQPSGQDMRVASKAAVMAAKARTELATQVEPEMSALSEDADVADKEAHPVRPQSDQGVRRNQPETASVAPLRAIA